MTDLRTAAQQALEALEDYKYAEARDALRAALAEPMQEPVAMLWQHRETGRTRVLMPNERTATDVAAAWDVVGPLYLAPPQRKPLTEWQINDLMANIDPEDVDSWSFRQGVYATEKHHGVRP